MSNLQQIIEAAFEKRAEITPKTVDAETRAAIEEVIEGLDSGKYRVAEKIDGEWVTHQWLKKAVLLSFRINDNQIIDGAETKYYDKVALKFADYTEERFAEEGFRVVPAILCKYWCLRWRRQHGRYLGNGWFMCTNR